MIPWPIALLTLFYGVLAAASAAGVLRILSGLDHRQLFWVAAWLILCSVVMCGLPLLKSWARMLAIIGSLLMTVMTLTVAALLVATDRPGIALAATFAAAIHVLIIRYLQRPVVQRLFEDGARSSEHSSQVS